MSLEAPFAAHSSALQPDVIEAHGGQLAWQAAVSCILSKHDLTIEQIQSASHKTKFVACRREVAAMLRGRSWSLPKIGRYLNRDHTTIRSLLLPKLAEAAA